MPPPDLRPELMATDIQAKLIEGLKRSRPDLSYPESSSDVTWMVISLLRQYDVTKRKETRSLSDLMTKESNAIDRIAFELAKGAWRYVLQLNGYNPGPESIAGIPRMPEPIADEYIQLAKPIAEALRKAQSSSRILDSSSSVQ